MESNHGSQEAGNGRFPIWSRISKQLAKPSTIFRSDFGPLPRVAEGSFIGYVLGRVLSTVYQGCLGG